MNESIQHMHHVLDELIRIATKLRNISRQRVGEEELAPLQKEQERVLHELSQLDRVLQNDDLVSEATHAQFHKKLMEFQTLNQEFIQNLNTSHGLIQFDLAHNADETDEPLWERLKHLSFRHPSE